jgi:hypothetical protein
MRLISPTTSRLNVRESKTASAPRWGRSRFGDHFGIEAKPGIVRTPVGQFTLRR